jgi:hypothetical protein
MSTPEERFDLVVESIEATRALTKNLSTIGIYDAEEYKSFEVILKALNRAMYVLDPVRADEYIKGVLDDYVKEAAPRPSEKEEAGLYL